VSARRAFARTAPHPKHAEQNQEKPVKKVNEFVEHLHEVFRLFGPIRSRPMFGGYGIYHQALMIGLVADDVLYLKTDAVSAPHFVEAGCRPFEYTKNGVTMKMSYASAPIEIYDDPESARAWAARAYDAALRSKSKAAKRSK
jgi:DNA transformation protein and related proteins